MRHAKYLNAREYAQMLRKGNNADVADFAEDFLEALDFSEDGSIPRLIIQATENAPDDVITYAERIEWLERGSDMLGRVEELIEKGFPEFANMDADDAVAEIIKRFQPVKFLGGQKLEYDL